MSRKCGRRGPLNLQALKRRLGGQHVILLDKTKHVLKCSKWSQTGNDPATESFQRALGSLSGLSEVGSKTTAKEQSAGRECRQHPDAPLCTRIGHQEHLCKRLKLAPVPRLRRS
jgi:hypothetical protein